MYENNRKFGKLDMFIIKDKLVQNEYAYFHPSGNLTPSKSDVLLTDRMQKVCTMASISILDHVIIGAADEYYSFKEKNLMPLKKVSYESDIEKFHLDTMEKVAEKLSIKDNLKSNQRKVIKEKVKLEKSIKVER